MKFRLEIELGNDAMQSFYDVCGAITEATGTLTDCIEPMQAGERGTVVDGNGNTVGKWEVIEEPKPSAMERTTELETFYDLCVNLGYGIARGEVDTEHKMQNSRDRMDTLLDWANEFNKLHAATDWAEADYLETIDDFYAEKIKPFLRVPVVAGDPIAPMQEQAIRQAGATFRGFSPMRAFMDAQRDMANPPVHIGTEIEEDDGEGPDASELRRKGHKLTPQHERTPI